MAISAALPRAGVHPWQTLARARGPRAADQLVAENERLRTEVDHLQVSLARAEKVIAVQGNVSALLRELTLESAERKPERLTFLARTSGHTYHRS
jgi:hypothetical protein